MRIPVTKEREDLHSIRNNRYSEKASEWEIPPFWQKLNSFFLFPLQLEPLLYGLLLSVGSYGILVLGLYLSPFFAVVLGLGLVLSVSRYAFKVAALASRGITDSSEYRASHMDEGWKWLPWKFFGVLVVFGFFVGFLRPMGAAVEVVANVAVALLTPAAWMVLTTTHSLRSAANPFELLGTIFAIGKPYLLLCFFLFLLQYGMPMVVMLMLEVVKPVLLLPLVSFAAMYFTWVMAAMIGYVMYQYHAVLGINVERAPQGHSVPQVDPAVQEAKHRDALIAQLVQSNQMDEAVSQAREWQRESYRNLPDYRRYFRVLKLTDRVETLSDVGQGFIPMLIAHQRIGEAMEAWVSCVKSCSDFRLNSDQASLDLAKHAWKGGKPKYVLLLAKEFDKRFAGSDLIPAMLELVVRAYKQGLGQPMAGMKVYIGMKQRFPEHPSTKEVEWLLRDELEMLSSKS